jgi:hypothetical protein
MRDFLFSVLKMTIAVLIIFLIPFMLPLILKLFLTFNIFSGIDEFKNIISIFNNLYIFIYILLGIGILLWFFHKWETIKELLKDMNFSLIFGNKKILAEHVKEEFKNINEQKEFLEKISKESNNESENTINAAKTLLGIKQSNNQQKKCRECNKKELEDENSKLRDFATYNMINTEAKSLLHIIYNEKYINKDQFKSRIIQGYKKRNKKNVKFTHKEIDKIARNKYDTIFEGLKFLNIIEPSEDDKIIKLTEEGKKFVEKYIEKKEVV